MFMLAGQTHLFEVGPNATAYDVKAFVQAREGEPLSCSTWRPQH
jgi:hypothetical protein